MALKRLLDLLDDVEDPRCGGKVEHRLTDILVIAVCAVIACAESWDDIALYVRNKLPRLKTFPFEVEHPLTDQAPTNHSILKIRDDSFPWRRFHSRYSERIASNAS